MSNIGTILILSAAVTLIIGVVLLGAVSALVGGIVPALAQRGDQ